MQKNTAMNSLFPIYHYSQFFSPFQNLADNNKNENDTDGYEYFTMKEDLEDSNIYIIDPNGVKYLKSRTDLDMDIWVIYVYASDDVRRERAKKSRSDYETEYEKRVLKEKAQFDEAEKNFEFDYLVKNENSFENSLNKFEFYLRHIL